MNKAKGFWWSDEAVAMLKERYRLDGPKRLAEILGTTQASVVMKARHLSIEPNRRNAKPTVWTSKMLGMLKERYPVDDVKALAKEMELPLYIIQGKARRLGIRNLTKMERASKHKAERNTSCNIHYFDEWNADMAYILGFLFADGSVSSGLTNITVGIAAKDESVLQFIKEKMRSTREFRRVKPNQYRQKGDRTEHKEAVYLALGSTILVRKAMELGLKPRKTYNNDPFPQVPDALLPHFIRGYFDGDGSVCLPSEGGCRISFIGTCKFIAGICDSLVRLAGMSANRISTEMHKVATCARVSWSAVNDLRKFHNFIYPEGFGFCLERKQKRLEEWLSIHGLRYPREDTVTTISSKRRVIP